MIQAHWSSKECQLTQSLNSFGDFVWYTVRLLGSQYKLTGLSIRKGE